MTGHKKYIQFSGNMVQSPLEKGEKRQSGINSSYGVNQGRIPACINHIDLGIIISSDNS